MMKQYMSIESNLESFEHQGGTGFVQRHDFGLDSQGSYTPPKLGGKEPKQARRVVQQTRSGDELIIYAQISMHVNPYTQQVTGRTGQLELYVFQLDRRFPEEG